MKQHAISLFKQAACICSSALLMINISAAEVPAQDRRLFNFVDEMCGPLKDTGHSEQTTITGQGSAEVVAKIMQKYGFAIQGGGDFEKVTQAYDNVKQAQLHQRLEKTQDCRMQMVMYYKDRVE